MSLLRAGRALSILWLALGLAAPALAQRQRGEAVLNDLLLLQILPRELIAIDAMGGPGPSEALELGERVLRHDSRGKVGVVYTNKRILAVGVGSGSWQHTRYRSSESAPGPPMLGDRVALIVTDLRVLGFDGGSGNLVERRLGPRESVLYTEVSSNVAVAVTDRHAFGLSPFSGGFFAVAVNVGERLESVEATGNFAIVTTSRRTLTFKGPAGIWAERTLDLH